MATVTQDLVKMAAAVGSVQSLVLLLNQSTIRNDADELEESVDNGLHKAAQYGHVGVVDMLLEQYPEESKPYCVSALIKATM